MTWTKAEIITDDTQGCANCHAHHDSFPLTGVVAVGFGIAEVTRDGQAVYTEPQNPHSEDEFWTGADAERAALADPDHDWRIRIFGPLAGREWQRQGEGHWPLIARDEGFA